MVPPTRHRLRLAVGLAVLAPHVGEFLLGNVPISQYAGIVVLVPLYGAGALLVREIARRLGFGWPTIVLFAAAYALIEEGPVDQMVFNPGYLDLPSFAGYAEIPGLGISGTLVLWSLALHTVWSICVPIVLVESFDATPTVPWLGKVGLAVTAAVFGLACVFLGWSQADDLDFVGSPAQFTVSIVGIVALVGAGLAVGRRQASHLATPDEGSAAGTPGPPRPVLLGLAAFAVTSGYWIGAEPPLPGLLRVVAQGLWWLLAAAVAVVAVGHWSRRRGWDGRHRLALAVGALATYALWFGPAQAAEAGTSAREAALGAVVFGLAAVVLVLLAARHQEALHRAGRELSEPVPQPRPER